MADIVLTTLNARYAHASLGLRCLLANLGELAERAGIQEYIITQRPLDIVESILAAQPRVVGIGVYVWNVEVVTEMVALLRRVRPDVVVVLGGPEVTDELENLPVAAMADYVISGEGEVAFAALCTELLAGVRPEPRHLVAPPPDLATLRAPYALYDDHDVAHRVIYVETSRGCAFRCAFCLSARDRGVRRFAPEHVTDELTQLYARGVRRFKFLDRTFNVRPDEAIALLEFLEPWSDELFVHFEAVPERLTDELIATLARFPRGAVQLEVGVQTLDVEVAQRIDRPLVVERVLERLETLCRDTGAHVHADLIVGLPGEDIDSFARGFDRLLAAGPDEIQVGILKRLRGTPLRRYDEGWGMVYEPRAPYAVLQTGAIDFPTMQRLRRFARFWDVIANSGNFKQTLPLVWRDSPPFAGFLALSDWLFDEFGSSGGIALRRLCDTLFHYLVDVRGLAASEVGATMVRDYQATGRSDAPAALAPFAPPGRRRGPPREALPQRQARHRDASES